MLGAALLFLSSLHLGRSYVPFQWACLSTVLLLVLCWQVYRRAGWLAALTVAYTLGNSLVLYSLPRVGRYTRTPDHVLLALHWNALTALVGYAGIVALVLWFSRAQLRTILRVGVPIFTVGNACLVLVGSLTGWNQAPGNYGVSGLIDYASVNGCLLAAGLGSILAAPWHLRYRATALLVTGAAIVLSRSSIPYGAAVVTVSAYHLKRGRSMVFAVCLTAALLCVGVFAESDRQFFHSSGRFNGYRVFLSAWWTRGDIWFGTGPGSFPVLSRFIQADSGFMVGQNVLHSWLWLHSDWLQCLFELGWIGFALYVSLFVQVLRACWRRTSLDHAVAMSVICGLAASAGFNYPIRYPAGALLVALATGYVLRGR